MSTQYLCVHKVLRAQDGAVHVGGCGKVHHDVRHDLPKGNGYLGRIRDVAQDEGVAALEALRQVLQVSGVAGIRERVVHHDTRVRVPLQHHAGKVAANKARPAGDQVGGHVG